MPGLGGVRRGHAMAAGAGLGGNTPGEIIAMADLAGDQAPTIGTGGQLGSRAVNGHGAPGRNGLVVAERGGAGRNIAARRGDRELMALGTGIQPGDGAAGMAADPAGGMVVLAEVRGGGTGTPPATAAPEEGQREGKGQTERADHRYQAFQGEEIDGNFSATRSWGHAEDLEFGSDWIYQSIIESFSLSRARSIIADFELIPILNVAT